MGFKTKTRLRGLIRDLSSKTSEDQELTKSGPIHCLRDFMAWTTLHFTLFQLIKVFQLLFINTTVRCLDHFTVLMPLSTQGSKIMDFT